jgi:protein TonB
VIVNVTIDNRGNVVSAKAVQGHPLLRSAAEDAARRSKFKPVSVNGQTVNAKGSINYNFVN